jgi:hypothetical protein
VILERALELRGLERVELLERAPGATVEEGVRYEKLRPVARVRALELWPRFFYFDGERQVIRRRAGGRRPRRAGRGARPRRP